MTWVVAKHFKATDHQRAFATAGVSTIFIILQNHVRN